MAGEKPQETGQCHGSSRISLERGDDRSPEGRIRSRKRQPEVTQYLEIGNGWGIGMIVCSGDGGDIDFSLSFF
jgi:hypothetical protein